MKILANDSRDTAINLTHILDEFDTDYTTREYVGRDMSYRKVLKSEAAAIRFNYQSDYWGYADDYQESHIELMSAIEPYIGKRVKFEFDDGIVYGTLEGALIDTQYNSISHTNLLLDNVEIIDL